VDTRDWLVIKNIYGIRNRKIFIASSPRLFYRA
jgi:hypothetical protein